MASSTQEERQQQQQQHQHHLTNLYGATAAPPPTPSTHPGHLSTSDAADALSRLLHRLPPTLSLPTRVSPSVTCPALVALSDQSPELLRDQLLSSSSHGFFQLTNHPISPQLARSAESDSLALFDLTLEQKHQYFPKNWPLGFDGDDDEDGEGRVDSFCLDSSCSAESTELSLASLREFTRELGKLGLEAVEMLSRAVGFENPFGEEQGQVCSLMWISEVSPGNKTATPGKFYPYVIGLQYQIRCRKYSLLADSGWVSVSPEVDSVMIIIGDVAQVWSNGKLKKVRGRPVLASSADEGSNSSRCISMSLLLTLPLESTISPLLPKVDDVVFNGDDEDETNGSQKQLVVDSAIADDSRKEKLFNCFCFEDYAWRVYHERLLYKDPLERYRIQ